MIRQYGECCVLAEICRYKLSKVAAFTRLKVAEFACLVKSVKKYCTEIRILLLSLQVY